MPCIGCSYVSEKDLGPPLPLLLGSSRLQSDWKLPRAAWMVYLSVAAIAAITRDRTVTPFLGRGCRPSGTLLRMLPLGGPRSLPCEPWRHELEWKQLQRLDALWWSGSADPWLPPQRTCLVHDAIDTTFTGRVHWLLYWLFLQKSPTWIPRVVKGTEVSILISDIAECSFGYATNNIVLITIIFFFSDFLSNR